MLTPVSSEFHYEGRSKLGKSNLSANLVSVMQAGAVVGALGAFPCADKWGRKVWLPSPDLGMSCS